MCVHSRLTLVLCATIHYLIANTSVTLHAPVCTLLLVMYRWQQVHHQAVYIQHQRLSTATRAPQYTLHQSTVTVQLHREGAL
jgi:hypothetical protein